MRNRSPDKLRPATLALLVTAGAALLIGAAAFGTKSALLRTRSASVQQYEVYYSPNPSASQEIPPSSYRVTVYQGKIGVFAAGENDPFLTADVPVYLLPEEDQRLLREGISAQSLAEVRAILEDYR